MINSIVMFFGIICGIPVSLFDWTYAWIIYPNRLKIPEAEHGKSCNAGRLRKAEGCRPYRLRYTVEVSTGKYDPNQNRDSDGAVESEMICNGAYDNPAEWYLKLEKERDNNDRDKNKNGGCLEYRFALLSAYGRKCQSC